MESEFQTRPQTWDRKFRVVRSWDWRNGRPLGRRPALPGGVALGGGCTCLRSLRECGLEAATSGTPVTGARAACLARLGQLAHWPSLLALLCLDLRGSGLGGLPRRGEGLSRRRQQPQLRRGSAATE